MKSKGYDTTVITIITNSKDYLEISQQDIKEVIAKNDIIFTL
ncbi:hypothetical protein [Clostridium estertheticum]|nr:hypothetical protein [Clostridium estertheticum]